MADEHIAQRPKWLCRTCGEPWPCEPAQVDLTEEFAGMSPSLGMYLTGQWISAAADLPDTDVAELYQRIVGWRRERM